MAILPYVWFLRDPNISAELDDKRKLMFIQIINVTQIKDFIEHKGI